MPKLKHENLGSVQKTAYLTATIASVDSEFDTACFTGIGKCPAGSDIPIFYHCEYEEGKEPAQRDNGALEGASGAFSEDDEVIVQCEVVNSTTYKPLYVIGFVDKPKSCLWEPWGETICENHLWDSDYRYKNSGEIDYRVYSCGLGPEVTLTDGILSYSHTYPGDNIWEKDDHKIDWNQSTEAPYGIKGIVKLRIDFPVVEASGTPHQDNQRPIMYVSIGFDRIIGSPTNKSIILYDRFAPGGVGPGEHELELDDGNPVVVRDLGIYSRVHRNCSILWSCNYIHLLK